MQRDKQVSDTLTTGQDAFLPSLTLKSSEKSIQSKFSLSVLRKIFKILEPCRTHSNSTNFSVGILIAVIKWKCNCGIMVYNCFKSQVDFINFADSMSQGSFSFCLRNLHLDQERMISEWNGRMLVNMDFMTNFSVTNGILTRCLKDESGIIDICVS